MAYFEKMVIREGENFDVNLKSQLGSTLYGWCLSKLPEKFALITVETIAMDNGIGYVNQKFVFGNPFISPQKSDIENVNQQATFGNPFIGPKKAKLEFIYANVNDLKDVKDILILEVTMLPSGTKKFVPYSENALLLKHDYVGYDQEPMLKYGYPCVPQEAVLKYGYPCMPQEPVLKYGYPCVPQEPVLKYGYPCATHESTLKYGYPCVSQEPVLKYGYPCTTQSPMLKYGYPDCGEMV